MNTVHSCFHTSLHGAVCLPRQVHCSLGTLQAVDTPRAPSPAFHLSETISKQLLRSALTH